MKIRLLIVLILFTSNLIAQYTTIIDGNFEQRLIDLGIDTDGVINQQVLTSDIVGVESLDVSDKDIYVLTGIEAFTALKTLNCSSNKLLDLNVSQNTNLITLDCHSNGLSTLNVSANVNLTTLNCRSNSLKGSLDCSTNTALTSLICSINGLEALNVSANIALTTLDCYNNKLNTLDVSTNVNLTTLNCYNNYLTILDISKNILLTAVNCRSNQLKVLDVFKNVALANLNCRSNELVILDVSKNKSLTSLDCSSNKLTSLNLKNETNTLLQSRNFTNNSPTLTCIQVDDVAYSNSVWATSKDLGASYDTVCTTTYTIIPDANFETKLSASGYDKSGGVDKLVFTADIAGVTELDVSSLAIADLTGIEDFTALTALSCTDNDLTTLDITENVNLTSLYCAENELVNLDISKNDKLVNLDVSKNKLVNLDVSKNTELLNLNCHENELVNLNISQNVKLTSLDCAKNKLENLDAIKNTELLHLNCNENQIDILDVSQNSKLITLHCNFNQLTTLDVSNNKVLTMLDCSNNQLTSLSVKNGNNNHFDSAINFKGNDSSICIQVDDTNYANSNWGSAKDFSATYSIECDAFYTYIGDSNFERKLINLNIDKESRVIDGKVLTKSINTITRLNVSYSSIESLSGIEDFAALTELICSNNKLASLDVSENTALTALYCHANKLIDLNVSGNTNLVTLHSYDNQLSSLNLSTNTALKTLYCHINKLESLIVSENTALITLYCYYNQLTTLDVSHNTALKELVCFSNKLTNLNIDNGVLEHLECDKNQLKTLDVSKSYNIKHLECEDNQLTSLDVSQNTALTTFYCFNNSLTSLDVSKNVNLTILSCQSNKLSSLNLKNGNYTKLMGDRTSFRQNPNLYCIEVDNVTYSNNNWANSKDDKAEYRTNCNAIMLPSNNFVVESKGETCADLNNGEINITANANYPYTVNINGVNHYFTGNNVNISNLTPGTYQLTISIPDEIFNQTFKVVIPQATTITGKSSVFNTKISVDITQGTAPYTVFVDGIEQFETTSSNFTVDLKQGRLLEVKTAKACEGVYTKEISLQGEGLVSAYPNPTNGLLEITLPTSKQEVIIEIYSTDSRLISQKMYTIENGKVQLTLEDQPTGVYMLKIELDTPINLKIIKN